MCNSAGRALSKHSESPRFSPQLSLGQRKGSTGKGEAMWPHTHTIKMSFFFLNQQLQKENRFLKREENKPQCGGCHMPKVPGVETDGHPQLYS